jgi:uncharacterized membrane protein
MTDLPPVPPRPRAPGWMRWTLIASLALNLAVVGVIAGTAIKRMTGDARGPSVRALHLGPLTAALDADDRRALRRAFREQARDLRGLRADQAQGQAALLAALRAEPFDADAVRAQLAEQRARLSRGFDLGQTLLVDHLAGMSTADRAAFADRLEERLSRPRRGPRSDGD